MPHKWLDIHLPIQRKANVQLWESNDSDEEKWIFEDAGNGYVYIQSKTGFYLDIENDAAVNNANIQIYYFVGNDSQRWRIEDLTSYVDVDEGIYTVHSAYNDNMCLDIAGNSTENRANIQLYKVEDTDVQKFQITKHGKYYRLKSVYADKWLDIRTPIGNNSNVQLWGDYISDEDYWIFEDAGGGYVYIRSKLGYYLDLQGDRAVNRANIQIYNYLGTKSQKWRLDRCDKEIAHNYTSVVIAPTCTEKGYTLHTCTKCGDSYKDTYTNAVGHKYSETVVAPTASAQGYTLHTCSVCGHSYKDNYTAKLITNNSTLSASSIVKGQSVTMTAKAVGGTSPYKYAYLYKTSNGKWSVLRNYSTASSYTFKPTAAGKYTLMVKVKDSKGTIVSKSFVLNVIQPLSNTSKVSSASITKDQSVKLTGAASGGTSPYKYAYFAKAPNGNWYTLKDYSTAASFNFKPKAVGKYTLTIKVKDSKNAVVSKSFTLTVRA